MQILSSSVSNVTNVRNFDTFLSNMEPSEPPIHKKAEDLYTGKNRSELQSVHLRPTAVCVTLMLNNKCLCLIIII